MKQAFELAVEASYYAGALYGVLTNPNQHDKTVVASYATTSGQTVKSIAVPKMIADIFGQITSADKLNDETKKSLLGVWNTLEKTLKIDNRAVDIQNIQIALGENIGGIRTQVSQLNLAS